MLASSIVIDVMNVCYLPGLLALDLGLTILVKCPVLPRKFILSRAREMRTPVKATSPNSAYILLVFIDFPLDSNFFTIKYF